MAEIEGVIKLGSTEEPEEGIIRYDSVTSDFQGYTGNEWKTFLKKSGGSIPMGAIPVHCNNLQIENAGTRTEEVVCRRADNNEVITPIDEGMHIIVNTIVVGASVAGEPTGAGFVTIWKTSNVEDTNGNDPSKSAIPYLLHDGNYSTSITSDLAPLMVVNQDERILAKNFSGDFNVFVSIRGFLTTSLEY